VTPDLMTLAKPLASGLPIGAVLATQAVAEVMEPGDHGSTFAAGPLVCRVAQVVLNRVSHPDFLADVRRKGEHLAERLAALVEATPLAREARGRGLIWGIDCQVEATSVIAAGYQHGLLVCAAGPQVVRLLPPLTISLAELDELVDRLQAAFEQVERTSIA
jgi:acetylornithine/succinyldiaminopimelate/putrescine aminotransferase